MKNDKNRKNNTVPGESPAIPDQNEPETIEFPPATHMDIPGVPLPGVELPAYNPPVPNRAWTAMRAGRDIEELTEEEKRDLYIGHDDLF